jgi:hypothetical protein
MGDDGKNSTRKKRCRRARGTHDLDTEQHALSVVRSLHKSSTMRSSISCGREGDMVVSNKRCAVRRRCALVAPPVNSQSLSPSPWVNLPWVSSLRHIRKYEIASAGLCVQRPRKRKRATFTRTTCLSHESIPRRPWYCPPLFGRKTWKSISISNDSFEPGHWVPSTPNNGRESSLGGASIIKVGGFVARKKRSYSGACHVCAVQDPLPAENSRGSRFRNRFVVRPGS